jgi:hypothetical protein
MSFVGDLLKDNFVWDAIVESLPHPRNRGWGGFDINVCCPMCTLRGEKRPDQYFRCGLVETQSGLQINCLNCQFKARWEAGRQLPKSLVSFMEQIGVDSRQIKKIAHRAFVLSKVSQQAETNQIASEVVLPEYMAEVPLPEGSRLIRELAQEHCQDAAFLDAYNYLLSRGEEFLDAYDFYWCPNDDKMNLSKRIIIPVTFKHKIVGWTGRAINNDIPDRYYASHPSDILFNSEILNDPYRKFIPIMEGPLDAIAISGVATFGAKLSKKQLKWIQNSGKTPVLVADRDTSGIRVIETAIKLGW